MKERVTEYTCCPKCGLPFLTETDEQIAKRLWLEWANTGPDQPFLSWLDWLDGRDDD